MITQQPEVNFGKSTSLSRTTSIVLCAMFTALTYVFTMINVNPLGLPGGLVHLGNIPFFIAAILFGKKIGMISGGVGMALFDVLSPYAIWAPFTLVIGFATGYVVGLVTERHKRFLFYILAMVCAAAVKVVGYYIAEGIISGNWISPIQAVPANLAQVIIASIVVLAIIEPLRIAANKTILRGH
jgi:uncharacterized membrane protein